MSVITTSSIDTEIEAKRDLIRKTFGKDLTNDEFELFLSVSKHTGLDPTIRQIHAVKRKGSMTIQVGIDGLRSIAERTGNYSPGREPTYEYTKDGAILSCTASVKKRTNDGTWHEVRATAFFSEYKPDFENHFWRMKGHVMIAKCAEALAIRKAFPSVTGNLYADDEMDQAEPAINTEALLKDNPRPVPKVVSEEIIDCVPNEVPCDELGVMSGMRALDLELQMEGIPSDRLQEWINLRCSMKKSNPDTIIRHCLQQDFLPKFKKSYSQWLGQPVAI